MKKITSVLLLVFLVKISHGQIKAFRDASTRESFTVLVGPDNVDRHYPGQSDEYINEYEKLKERIEKELSRAQSRFFKLENKRVRNKSRLDRYDSKIDACYEELDLLEAFISYWTAHEERYKKAQNILTAKSDSLKCFSLAGEDEIFHLQDFQIIEKEAEEVLIYYEYVDSSYFATNNEWREIKYLKEDKNILLGLPYTSKEPMMVITDTYLAILRTFEYDEVRNEFYREIEVELQKGFKQYMDKGRNIEVRALDLERVDCEGE